jgi:hypothetical protein
MTKRNVGGVLLGLSVSVTAAIASCSFPTYDIVVTGTAGSTGGASATSSSGSVGGGGNGGASSTGTTSSASSTSSTSTSSASSTGTGVPCVSDGGPCDCDNDKALAKSCAMGTDCNDNDPLVYPGQMTFFKTKIVGSTDDFDYDCDDAQTYEIKDVLVCNNSLNCDQVNLRWKGSVPACGVFGQLGKCKLTKDLIPACIDDLQNMQKQGCR